MSNTPSDAEIIELMCDGYNCRYNLFIELACGR